MSLLRDHEQVDQHQPDGVGSAHVAEGLVGDLPLAVPLDRIAAPGVVGLADEELAETAAVRRLDAAQQLPQVRFIKVESDAAPQASAAYAIRSIPTLILFNRGLEVARRSGAVPTTELVAWVRQNAGPRAV